jgi:uridine monophosphate synthetase
MQFFERLEARARAVGSLLCVGLDPHPSELPEDTAQAALDACLRLMHATAPYAAAFKPNAAFFERFGADGWYALRALIGATPDGIPVILDAKRGDIPSTAAAYAEAAWGLGADAITLNPYLGRDGVTPFVERAERGAFVLCRTSNPSAPELQGLDVGGRALFEEVARVAPGWGPHGNVGLVVGATAPDDLARARAAAPGAWILAPGVGAQGGDLEATVRAGRRSDGLGLLVSVSRALSRAADPGAAAAALVAQLRAAGAGAEGPEASALTARIAEGLIRVGCVRFGSFKLKSGLTSPIYLDLRRLIGDMRLLDDVAAALAGLVRGVPHDLLAPLPYAATPIGTAVCLRTGTPMVYPRREVKDYGTKAAVEGVFEPGQRALILDDLATTGDSKIEGAEKLRAAGLEVRDVAVLIDRESGAREMLAGAGLGLHAVFTLRELLGVWEGSGAIRREQGDEVRAFLAAT